MISDGKLVVLHEAPYETESVLQQALASFPEVLAGQATTAGQPGGLLLVRRVALPPLMVVVGVGLLLGVFLVPTTGAAAARVAYLSAGVSVVVGLVVPAWRWSRGRGLR